MSLSWCFVQLFFLLFNVKLAVVEAFNDLSKVDNGKCHPDLMNELSDQIMLTCEINSELNQTVMDLGELKDDLSKTRSSIEILMTHLELHMQVLLAHDDQLHMHDNEHPRHESSESVGKGPLDCSDIRAMGFTVTGIYRVYPGNDGKRIQADVYCDFNSFKESWLVFQRRKDGSENFDRIYSDYERGFGNLTGEFWLGNVALHLLTANRKYRLRVELEDFEGEKRCAEYSTFNVDSAKTFYRLTVGGYFGNAGDSLSQHSSMMFSAKNVDKDRWNNNCAQTFLGGWWYVKCHPSNLNGLYLNDPLNSKADGLVWSSWHGLKYSLKATEMKITQA